MKPIVVLHTETFKDSITSIGAVYLHQPDNEHRLIVESEFERELRIIGDDDVREDLREPQRTHPEKAVKDFALWLSVLKEPIYAGFGIHQHLNSLRHQYRKYNVEMEHFPVALEFREICYMSMLKNLIKSPDSMSFENILDYVGLHKVSCPKSSLEQASLESEVLSRFIHGHVLKKEYIQFGIPEYLP
jgi:hypothetical protein